MPKLPSMGNGFNFSFTIQWVRLSFFSYLATFLALTILFPKEIHASPQVAITVRLSELLANERLSGLSFEQAEDVTRLQKQAREFVLFRKGKLGSKKTKELQAACKSSSDPSMNPFCPYLDIHSTLRKKRHASRNSKKERRLSRSKIIEYLKKARIKDLENSTGVEISDALKQIPNLKLISPILQKALIEKTCPSTALLLALGLRVESDLPGEDFKALATLLYQKGRSCGNDAASAQATYRLGLMKIWDGKYQEAENTLSQIAESPLESSYRMRIGYWRYFCADQLKNEELKTTLRKWLKKEYPLSLHGLLAQAQPLKRGPTQPDGQDPEVRLRSLNTIELNAKIRATEALLSEGEVNLASDLLLEELSRVTQLPELPLQLYWAVLLERSGEHSSGFELVARIFRANPALVSNKTLELMYPLREVKAVGEMISTMDPFLVLSVIRQESAFNVNAKSSAGALGLMQLRFSTARQLERISKSQLYKPNINVRLGVKYLQKLLKSFDGEVELALAAYNAGPGRIKEWMRRYPIKNRLLFLDLIPTRETRDYVSSIARNYYWYSHLYTKAFEESHRGKRAPDSDPHLLKLSHTVQTSP